MTDKAKLGIAKLVRPVYGQRAANNPGQDYTVAGHVFAENKQEAMEKGLKLIESNIWKPGKIFIP